jgi:hypothetical protein
MNKATKAQQVISVITFLALIATGTALNFVLTPPEFIVSERRRPATFPDLSWSELSSGDFARGFEAFSTDNFALRERLRTVRALTTFYVFMHLDKDGLFFDRRHGIGRFEKPDETQISESGRRLSTMLNLFGQDTDFYFAVIPEKSYYTSHSRVTISPHLVAHLTAERLPDDVQFIDLTTSLTVEDFYRTDLHWCQTLIWNVVQTLSQAMNFVPPPRTDTITVGDFFGVYYGQLAVPMRPDVMEVHRIDGVRAWYLNERRSALELRAIKEEGLVYSLDMFRGIDPYSIFLRGPQPVVWLETGNSTGRTLYIFRDSFGSSIAPLLALSESYDEIVLIDLRYIDGRILDRFVEFHDGADVLFLYSTQILNNADMVRGRG